MMTKRQGFWESLKILHLQKHCNGVRTNMDPGYKTYLSNEYKPALGFFYSLRMKKTLFSKNKESVEFFKTKWAGFDGYEYDMSHTKPYIIIFNSKDALKFKLSSLYFTQVKT